MHTTELTTDEIAVVTDPRQMTRSELRRLGMPRIVYLRRGMIDGQPAFAIHAADGTAMAVVEDVDVARELVAENNMTFVPVH